MMGEELWIEGRFSQLEEEGHDLEVLLIDISALTFLHSSQRLVGPFPFLQPCLIIVPFSSMNLLLIHNKLETTFGCEVY